MEVRAEVTDFERSNVGVEWNHRCMALKCVRPIIKQTKPAEEQTHGNINSKFIACAHRRSLHIRWFVKDFRLGGQKVSRVAASRRKTLQMKTSNTWSRLLSRRCWLFSDEAKFRLPADAPKMNKYLIGRTEKTFLCLVAGSWARKLIGIMSRFTFQWVFERVCRRAPSGNMLIKFVPAHECIETRQLIH